MLKKIVEKLRPARVDESLIRDIDSIIEKPSYFKLRGKVHRINPMLVEEFWAVANAIADMNKLKDSQQVTLDEAVTVYYNVIRSVCPTITKDELYECSQAQIGAILQYVYEHVHGINNEKKKTLIRSDLAQNRESSQ